MAALHFGETSDEENNSFLEKKKLIDLPYQNVLE